MKMSTLKEKLLLEKKALENDIFRLEREIDTLEETRKRRGDFHFTPKRTEESSTTPEVINIQKMESLLKLSSLVNGIHFENVEEHIIDSNVNVLRGMGNTKEVCFDFQVTVAKPLIVKSVLLKIEDEKLEGELHAWKKKYVKQKNFQILMQGIAMYSSLITRMKEVLTWLLDAHSYHVKIESHDLSGCVVKSINVFEGGGEPRIRVHWKIRWQEAEAVMLDRFVIDIGDQDNCTLETRTKWKKFLSANKYSFDDLQHFWIEIINEFCM